MLTLTQKDTHSLRDTIQYQTLNQISFLIPNIVLYSDCWKVHNGTIEQTRFLNEQITTSINTQLSSAVQLNF